MRELSRQIAEAEARLVVTRRRCRRARLSLRSQTRHALGAPPMLINGFLAGLALGLLRPPGGGRSPSGLPRVLLSLGLRQLALPALQVYLASAFGAGEERASRP